LLRLASLRSLISLILRGRSEKGNGVVQSKQDTTVHNFFQCCTNHVNFFSQDQPSSRPVSGSFSKYASHTTRPHAHSISLSATNPSHRVNRRKSVNASSASSTAQAAIAAALREQGGDVSAIPVNSHRRSLPSKRTESHSMNARPSMHNYFGPGAPANSQVQEAVEDNSNDEDIAQKNNKNRNRRASEGSHLIKGDPKKAGDLRCDTCGKGYKHSSCLTKHMYACPC
jgi:hypothetical protein